MIPLISLAFLLYVYLYAGKSCQFLLDNHILFFANNRCKIALEADVLLKSQTKTCSGVLGNTFVCYVDGLSFNINSA